MVDFLWIIQIENYREKTLQGHIFHTIHYFTNFKMLFVTVMTDSVHIVQIKI